MPGFVLKLIAPRADFAATMTSDERAAMMEHIGYWNALMEQGRVVAFGPVHDASGDYGIGIIVVEDLAAAEALRDGDPAMRTLDGFRTEIAAMPRLVTPTGSY